MKYIVVFLFTLNSVSSFSQEKIKDTMHLKLSDLKFCFGELETLTQSGGKYYYNRIEIDSIKYAKLHRVVTCICDSLYEEVAVGKYCKFYNKDSIVEIEGIWFPEFFKGPYKEYYADGRIKITGEYATKESEYGTKRGKWVYYKKNGKIKKTINYP